jgi:hypothetical protein
MIGHIAPTNNIRKRQDGKIALTDFPNEIAGVVNRLQPFLTSRDGHGKFGLPDLYLVKLRQSSGMDGDRSTAASYKYNVLDPWEDDTSTNFILSDVEPLFQKAPNGRPHGKFFPAKWGIMSVHYDPDNKGGILIYAHEVAETRPACP